MTAELWPLFEAVDAAGAGAWPALAAALHPVLLAMARRQPTGRLRASADSGPEIATRVLERLHAHEHAAIAKLCAASPRPPLEAWLRVVVRRAAIDFMRESPEYQRATATRDPKWVSLATLTSRVHEPAPDSIVAKRAELRGFLEAAIERAEAETRAHGEDATARLAAAWLVSRTHARRFVQRGRQYLAVLDAIVAGFAYPEIAAQEGLSRREVELTVQYLEEFLTARGFGATS